MREIAIVGAGPYGLAAAAHLSRAGLRPRVFGRPMSFWRSMPKGMLLRSRWDACSIADVSGPLTIEAFEAADGSPIARPVPLADFIRYGDWFRSQALLEVDERLVERIDAGSSGFSLVLSDGEQLEFGRVVVASGIAPFAHVPSPFRELPTDLRSHTSDHDDYTVFAGKRVLVVGGGQSALEAAALAREAGADLEVIARRGRLIWLTGHRTRSRLGRLAPLFYAQTDVGPAGMSRILAVPDLFRRFPRRLQEPMARRAIRPAGAAWLSERLAGIPIRVGSAATSVNADGEGVSVTTSDGRRRAVDHVLLGTGYRVDVARYRFLSTDLARRIDQVDGYPLLGRGLESSVPGLHFLGAPAAWSFGPLMRFVSGTWYASRALTACIAVQSHRG
jgi:hypothetical protein